MNETEFLAKQLIDWVNAMNDDELKQSKAITTAFPYIYRRYEYLKNTEVMISKAARKKFEDVFGKEHNPIDFDWYDTLNPISSDYGERDKRNPERIKVRQIRDFIYWEHFDTAYEFKEELQRLYNDKKLSIEKVVSVLEGLRICWVTKHENCKLNKDYKDERPDPIEAYRSNEIEVLRYKNGKFIDLF